MFKKMNDVLFLFLENPTKEYNVREVARIIKKSPATVSKELKKLKEEELLKEKRIKKFHFYKANLENELYKDIKKFYNIRKLKESGLIKEINKEYLKPTIILFGSAAEGLDVEGSDLDLLIISEKKEEFKKRKKYEKILNKKLDLKIVNDIKEIKNKHLINNIINGIKIQGRIKWI